MGICASGPDQDKVSNLSLKKQWVRDYVEYLNRRAIIDNLLDQLSDSYLMDGAEITAQTTPAELAKILGTFEWRYGSQHKND